MRSILILWTISVSFCSCSNPQSGSSSGAQSKIEFNTTHHDFGEIEFGADGNHEFVFTNSSDVPLVINNVKTSCGCTVPEWSKDPIAQGGKGIIKVKYNTKLPGKFRKSISVYSNAENSPYMLFIIGVVGPSATENK